MKTLIQIVVVALIAGGLSTAGSFYYLQNLSKTEKLVATAPNSKADGAEAEDSNAANLDPEETATLDHEDSLGPVTVNPPAIPAVSSSDLIFLEPPAAVRPPYIPESDEAGSLINKLRSREASTTNRERRLRERQEIMELVLDDLRFEQLNSSKVQHRALEATNLSMQTVDEARKATDAERKGIRDQRDELRRKADERIQAAQREKDQVIQSNEDALKSARTERDAAEESLKEVRSEREELRKQLSEMINPSRSDLSGSPENNGNLKKLATVLDSMPPENTANILQQMVKKGSIEAVVVILNAMKPRVAAKALSAIAEADPELSADLTERLKQIKLK